MKDPATILLVEDDRALLDGIADLLEVSEVGYELEVMKAINGLVALDAVAENEPDLIISDIMMPKMGGFEFLEQLRQQPDWVHIPVIFLTAKGTPEDIHKGRLSGAELYITKPYDSDELLQLVRSQLDRTFELRGNRQLKLDTLSRNIVQLLNHEFRTPLTYVTAYYELLADGLLKDDPASLNEYLRGIQVGTERLSNLIGNLVHVLELRTGEAAQRIEQHSEIIHDPVALFSSYCGERYWEDEGTVVEIHCDFPDHLPRIRIHRESLNLILDCLLDNAIKFSRMNREHEPRIELSVAAKEGYLAISVTDNGIGIPEHVQRRVFDLFFQYNREDLEQQGAGTGLAIVQGLTELQGGCVDVVSEVGQGSKFSIYLPEYVDEVTAPSQPVLSDDGRRKATILIVEDEWYLLEGLRDLLGVFGSEYDLNILTAGDGQEALQTLESNEPDLIISDITMPRMDGFEFLNQARKNPAWIHIPIIFLTARGERADILKGRSSGAEEYITKPYDAKELFAVIETQLNRHFQRQFAVQKGFEELKKSVLDLLLADMNLPLGIVSEYTQKLAENVDKLESDQDLMSYLRGIHSGSTQVSELFDDFILLVELQTGKTVDWFALQARPTDVNEVLMEISRIHQNKDQRQKVVFETQLSGKITPVLIDPDLLRQCLERLVDLIIALCNDCSDIDILLTSQTTNGQIHLTIGTQTVSITDEEAQIVNRLLSRPEPVVIELAEYDPALLITKGVVHYHEGSIELDVKDNRRLDFIFTFPVYRPAEGMIHNS